MYRAFLSLFIFVSKNNPNFCDLNFRSKRVQQFSDLKSRGFANWSPNFCDLAEHICTGTGQNVRFLLVSSCTDSPNFLVWCKVINIIERRKAPIFWIWKSLFMVSAIRKKNYRQRRQRVSKYYRQRRQWVLKYYRQRRQYVLNTIGKSAPQAKNILIYICFELILQLIYYLRSFLTFSSFRYI